LVIIGGFKSAFGRVEGSIRVGDRRYDLVFRSELELSDLAAEAFLLLALPAAMRCGGPLIIEAPVSQQLLGQIPEIQNIYRCWDSKLGNVEVRAAARLPACRPLPASAAREAIAFTAGVDSFYSALQSPEASLMFLHGLDIPLENHDLRKKVRERLAWAASELDRPLLEMETNLRNFSDRYLSWHLAFGGALAACALLLSRHIDVFGIPAGQTAESHHPDGAHPELDPLFSTEDVAIRTVGCEARRVDKVEVIAPHPVVQGALRVCWENRGDAYNCGVCEKCLRTMATLEIFGELQNFSTFAVSLDYRRLSWAVPAQPALDMLIRENLQAARAKSASPELIKSLEKQLTRGRSRLLRKLLNGVPRTFSDRYYRAFLRTGSTVQSC